MDHEFDGTRAAQRYAAAWRKSSYSGPSGNCVEAAGRAGGVALRDSRFPHGPALVFTSGAWDAFLRQAKDRGPAGFDLPASA